MPSNTPIPTETQSAAWVYHRSPEDVRRDPGLLGYAHHIIRAFDKEVLGITGVLCVDGRPTIYFRRDNQSISWVRANDLHRVFWNQGIATILVLADPQYLRVYSSQAEPVKENESNEEPSSLVLKELRNVVELIELDDVLHQIVSGKFYRDHPGSFNQKQSVDEFLLRNLSEARDQLVSGASALKEETAHALLGRLIFLCYLTDRGIINWTDYSDIVGGGIRNICSLLEAYDPREGFDRLYRLIDRLHRVFNGSMFDQDLNKERRRLKKTHYDILQIFFSVSNVKTRQGTLGFWAYDFNVIPVETISAIYEDFLGAEDVEGKREVGAYYTPRHLAEMVIDTAIEGDANWARRRYLDPACGSGMFLVTLFNRIASQWSFEHREASYRKKAKALLNILHRQICGIDIKRTACRIACFSLYLAFLDQFHPRDIRQFATRAGRKKRKILPKLLRYDNSRWLEEHDPTVFHGDFTEKTKKQSGFDYVIGNPPWSGRGTHQKAWEFMRLAPASLKKGTGIGCMLLPAKVLLNKTDVLQDSWFRSVSVERIINLSDFRFILFEHAANPALIVRFRNKLPVDHHRFAYDTPKVTGTDTRAGVITVFPRDRKDLTQKAVMAALKRKEAPKLWKSRFSGSARDWRLLDLLDDHPKLGQLVSSPYRSGNKRTLWIKGQGVQPDHKHKAKNPEQPWWKGDRLFLDASSDQIQLFVFPQDCEHVGDRFRQLYFARHPDLFEPPLVLISQGFTKIAYCNFPVLFQHSLQSIAIGSADSTIRGKSADLLLFLTVYLRSRLARYYLFHTSANWGIERDKVLFSEVLDLPFPLTDAAEASLGAAEILSRVVAATKAVYSELERALEDDLRSGGFFPMSSMEANLSAVSPSFAEYRKQTVDTLQRYLETEIYHYFDLTEEEINLVEDTTKVFEPSSTPPTRDTVLFARIPSLREPDENDILLYTSTLTRTLNQWAEGSHLKVQASITRIDQKALTLLTLDQSQHPQDPAFVEVKSETLNLLGRLYESSRSKEGSFEYPRTIMIFDGPRIHLLKPTTLLHWTRTAALNDADEIFASVVRQRRSESA